MGRELTGEPFLPGELGLPPLALEQAQALLADLDRQWHLARGGRTLVRQFTFTTLGGAIAFLTRVAELAGQDGHQPELCLKHGHRVSVALTTPAIGGLSRADFVLAARLQAISQPLAEPEPGADLSQR